MADGPKNPFDEDDDQNYMKKDGANPDSSSGIKNPSEGDFNKKSDILPDGTRRRDLDVEKGGLEMELDVRDRNGDVWDERSQEVDRMGSIDPLNDSASKRSMIWRLKRKRRRESKMQEQIEVNYEAMEAEKSTKFRDKINHQRSSGNNNDGRSV